MARGMPSMLALLGLLAVAGYQHRDKIGNAINKMQEPGGLLEGGTGGLASGVGELLNSFKTAGHGDVSDSWVRPGVPTQGLTASQVAETLGEENIEELSSRVGLSRDELLDRLATTIPARVDALTPEGRMPSDDDIRKALLPGA